jgi:Tol biopolymer transport system component/DNA-binding winged helix-turn-helix (wHTH) protein
LPLQTRQIYRFGPFTLDATAKVLLRDGEPVRLARKAVETLLALVEQPGRVLTKDELIEVIWQGRVVDEANLIQNIAVVRRTLGLKPGAAGYIETFPGRGYRLLGPIGVEQEEPHRPQPGSTVQTPTTLATAEPSVQTAIVAAPAGKTTSRARLIIASAALAAIAVAAVIWIFLLRDHRSAETRFQRTAVARLGGKEYQPAVSADGQNVAFVLERGGGFPSRIWMRSGSSPPAIVGKAGWAYNSPAWSPDGKSLAFLRMNGSRGELVIASQSAKLERVVATVFPTRYGLPNRHLDWSPDGRTLAFDDTNSADQPFAIDLISVATGERRRLTAPPANVLGDVDPRFSPDGRTISFIRVFHRARQGLFTIAAGGGTVRQLSRDDFQISGQDWAPGGRSIVMGSNRTGDFRLWRVAVDHAGAEPVADWTGTYGDAPIQLAVARRSPALLYSVLLEDFNIWRLDLKAKEGAPQQWVRIVNSSAQDASPQYSPDGAQICFRSDRTGEEQLWVSAADGSNPRQVTQGPLRPSVGRWSPDGKALVFNDSREVDLYVAAIDGSGGWRTRALQTKGLHPVFSADGKWIYAGLADTILRLPAHGGAPEVIAHAKGLSFGLSAGGRDLYFVKELTGSALWRLSLQTGEISKVLDGLVPYCSSCWAADSQGIYYLGTERSALNGQAIYFHSHHGGPDKLIVAYPEPLLPLGSGPFSLSPDGQSLLCVRVDPSNADLMQIEPYH